MDESEILSVPAPTALASARVRSHRSCWKSREDPSCFDIHSCLAVLVKTLMKESATPNFSEIRWAMKKRTRGWYRKLYYPVMWGLFCKPWNKDPYETADILLFERLGSSGSLGLGMMFPGWGRPCESVDQLIWKHFRKISARGNRTKQKSTWSWHVDTIDFFRSKEVIYQIFIIIFM